jgi:hypothetical protein
MNSSVQTGSSSKNGFHASFHWPSFRILSQAGVGAGGRGRAVDCAPAALASSSRIGAPMLQVWIDRSDAIFRTIRISSRLAPACSAARMCRRVPSGLRFVHAALTATPISSTSLRGKMPVVQGLVLICSQASAQTGSHARSRASTGSQGPVSGRPAASLLIDLVFLITICRPLCLGRRPAPNRGRILPILEMRPSFVSDRQCTLS